MPKHYKEMIDEIINKMDENVNEVLNPKIGDKLKHKFKNVNYDVEIVGMNTNASNLQLKLISNGPDKGRTITVQRDKVEEDAPANAVAHGGVDMNPTGKKKKDDAEDVLRRTIMKKMGASVKENTDNNNVVLKGINETLNKLEDKIDEKNGVKKEEVKIEEKIRFVDKFKV